MSALQCFLLISLLAIGCGTPAPPATPAESVGLPDTSSSTSAEVTGAAPDQDMSTARHANRKIHPQGEPIEKIAARRLPNLVRVHPKVISGGLPEGDSAFAELKALGVKTVISVDGARPDVATAEKHGLRYVHLPHGYDGVPDDRARELAKAVRDFPGEIYIHCHHGKHRSPAAAAVACVGAGLIHHDAAREVLAVAGTGENYQGLFQSVDDARRIGDTELDSLQADFPSTAKLPPLAEAMVAVEHAHDHLMSIEKAAWKTPADQPALKATHEALLLREHFTELLRTDDTKSRSDRFQVLMQGAERLSRELEESLKQDDADAESASKKLAAVTANCKACHQAFRDKRTSWQGPGPDSRSVASK